jgi:hypothetical protein
MYDTIGAAQVAIRTLFFGLRERHKLLEIGAGSLKRGQISHSISGCRTLLRSRALRHFALNLLLLPFRTMEKCRFGFCERNDVIQLCDLLRTEFVLAVNPNAQGMIVPNQRSDK